MNMKKCHGESIFSPYYLIRAVAALDSVVL